MSLKWVWPMVWFVLVAIYAGSTWLLYTSQPQGDWRVWWATGLLALGAVGSAWHLWESVDT